MITKETLKAKIDRLDADDLEQVDQFIQTLVHASINKPFPPTRVEEGLGSVGYQGPPKTLAEMEQGIMEEARRQWQRNN